MKFGAGKFAGFVGLALLAGATLAARPASAEASWDDQVFGSVEEGSSVKADKQRQLREQEAAVPAASADSLELSVFNPWTSQTRTLSVTLSADSAMTLTVKGGWQGPVESYGAKMTADQLAKIKELWGAVKGADAGEHHITVPVMDASEFTLSYKYTIHPSSLSRLTVVGSIDGPTPALDSQWPSAKPLVDYLWSLQNEIETASAGQSDVVQYTCTPESTTGGPVVGLNIAIVSKSSAADAPLFVRTAPVVPHPQYKYEELTKTSQHIEVSEYTSASYDVSFFFMGGARAHIQFKNGGVFANCVKAQTK